MMHNTIRPDFSAVIRQHRKAAGLTQKDLAELAGVGKTVVFDLEAGKATVQLNIVLAVLEALNIRLKLESPLLGFCSLRDDGQGESNAKG